MSARGEDTRRRLLDAAVEVVARVGYARATTRAIAEAAGVAEGTIYRHFPHKQHLFRAAVMERNRPVLEWMSGLPGRAGSATVEATLTETARVLGRLRRELIPLELAAFSDPSLRDVVAAAMDPPPGAPLVGPPQLLADYLSAEQRLGRVRADLDPRRTALTLLTMLFGVGMMPPDADGFPPAPLVESAVRLAVHGLEPRPA
ncbi:MAG: TetR/AcrR family transcriptional regulator [Kineosporiaceae bacterium]